MNNRKKRIFIAITGASGTIFAEQLISKLLFQVDRIYLSLSNAGRAVAHHELKKPNNDTAFSLLRLLQGEMTVHEKQIIRIFNQDDLFAPIASGSSVPTHMVVVPCSMGTLARIRSGLSSNLIERAADVVLKQKKELLICPRETPLNTIHLENMLALSRLGVRIIPITVAFYQHPKSMQELLDFMTGRILEMLGLEHQLYKQWNKRLV